MAEQLVVVENETRSATGVRAADDRISSRDLFALLWRRRLSILLMTLVITLAVATAAWLLPRKYEATVLLLPVEDDSGTGRMGSLGSAISQLGGIASLAGISSSSSGLKVESVATLESEALTERYIQQNDLLQVLYKDKWDATRMRWKTNDRDKIPTLWMANRYFRDHVRSVVDNVRTGLVSLTITWRDPRQAAQWANDLVKVTNDYLRLNAIQESERNSKFLDEEAKKTSVVAVQQAIYTLTETEIKKAMLAKGRDQYALKVLDPAVAPEKQSFPRPTLWILSAFFGGLFISIFWVLMRASTGPSANPAAG